MTALTCAHQVRLHGAVDALATDVCSFLAVPLLLGEAAVVVAVPEHRAAISDQLAVAGVDVAAARAEDRYVELDAAWVAAQYMDASGTDDARYRAEVGDLVTDLADRFGAVSVYGEGAGVLAHAGHVVAALELEDLWTSILEGRAIRSLCGYPHAIADAPDGRAALDSICDAHDGVARVASATVAVDLSVGAAAGSMARRTVQETCEGWGFGDEEWLADAVLVVSELVGNAVRHAGSRVVLSLDLDGDTVTVSVTDGSVVIPVPRAATAEAEDGRGFAIIGALADRWGVERLPSGKRVWAELRPCPQEVSTGGRAGVRTAAA